MGICNNQETHNVIVGNCIVYQRRWDVQPLDVESNAKNPFGVLVPFSQGLLRLSIFWKTFLSDDSECFCWIEVKMVRWSLNGTIRWMFNCCFGQMLSFLSKQRDTLFFEWKYSWKHLASVMSFVSEKNDSFLMAWHSELVDTVCCVSLKVTANEKKNAALKRFHNLHFRCKNYIKFNTQRLANLNWIFKRSDRQFFVILNSLIWFTFNREFTFMLTKLEKKRKSFTTHFKLFMNSCWN